MVKKIRVIDEPKHEVLSEEELRQEFYELAKAMDWKLWELLQTMQRLEKKLSVVDREDDE
jgi:Fe-S cluster biosynthesis and repair protein YggX